MNFSKTILSAILIIMTSVSIGQTTVLIETTPETGRDAYLRSASPDTNYGDHFDFSATAWTNNGVPVEVRSVMDFDLSSIPEEAFIISAALSLYSYDSPSNDSHSSLSGSNQSVIKKITQPWDEDLITWNNQPETSDVAQTVLYQTNDGIQHYPNIDITEIVQDMVDDPDNNFGIMLQLQTEEHYRRMLFASSDNENPDLRPTLEITYSESECLVLQPDAENGKDSFLRSLSPENNYGTHVDFMAAAWTNGGNEVNVRSLLDFDLSSIPEDLALTSATLSLYSYESPSNGSHSNLSGSNASVIRRVTGDWEENSVTWNNQPPTTDENMVTLDETEAEIENYLSIDVTNIYLDILANPESSFGLLLQLETEILYRRMIFASSDNENENLRPQLTLCFDNITSLEETNENMNLTIYPNPTTNGTFNISVRDYDSTKAIITNVLGDIVHAQLLNQTSTEVNLPNLNSGIYLVQIVNLQNGYSVSKKLLIK